MEVKAARHAIGPRRRRGTKNSACAIRLTSASSEESLKGFEGGEDSAFRSSVASPYRHRTTAPRSSRHSATTPCSPYRHRTAAPCCVGDEIDASCGAMRPSDVSRGSSVGQRSSTSHGARLCIAYSDDGDIRRVLSLRMSVQKANQWLHGLKSLLRSIPRVASPAHSRWALSCMAATSKRGATGVLRRKEFRFMLKRANASQAKFSADTLQEALAAFDKGQEHLPFPECLKEANRNARERHVLAVQDVTGLLVHFSTSSRTISELFGRHAVDGGIGQSEWLDFVHTEQLASKASEDVASSSAHVDDEGEVTRQLQAFNRAVEVSLLGQDGKLSLMQFALQLLGAQNDAITPVLAPSTVEYSEPATPQRKSAFSRSAKEGLEHPLSHYWTACSHNVRYWDSNPRCLLGALRTA